MSEQPVLHARREKAMVKVIAQQERQALRRTKGEAGGPKDDLELERETLLEAQRASGCAPCV